ncbi:unnamed protein product [Meloidogyne enterolobii]|uniref:Uncharacterized protein n=1 Tax=Meloidogyne enterolobii TaxID=390850 RepID=A0ACB1AJA8_MELEN
MPRGSLYSFDPIQFDEYKYMEENDEYKKLFKTFNRAFKGLVNKVIEFSQQNLLNIKLNPDQAEVIANELKEYDIIVEKSQTKMKMQEVKKLDIFLKLSVYFY